MLEGTPVRVSGVQEVPRETIQARRRSLASRIVRSEQFLFVLFVLPNLTLFTLFNYWPMIYNVYLSFVRWDMISPTKRWIGTENYEYLFFNERSNFYQVLSNTAVFTIGGVGGSVILGLGAALLLNQKLKGRDAARAIVFAPTLLSGAAIAVIWTYIFDPRFGLIASGMNAVGLTPINWLQSTSWAMPGIIIVYVWKNLGFAAVIYLAGLQGIPKDLYEAAKLDGAGPFERFRTITFPLLSPINFFLLVVSVLGTLQAFDIINVMTRGGPVNATNNLVFYVYQQAFINTNAGRAAAAALVLFLVMFIVTLIQLRVAERRVHYG